MWLMIIGLLKPIYPMEQAPSTGTLLQSTLGSELPIPLFSIKDRMAPCQVAAALHALNVLLESIKSQERQFWEKNCFFYSTFHSFQPLEPESKLPGSTAQLLRVLGNAHPPSPNFTASMASEVERDNSMWHDLHALCCVNNSRQWSGATGWGRWAVSGGSLQKTSLTWASPQWERWCMRCAWWSKTDWAHNSSTLTHRRL